MRPGDDVTVIQHTAARGSSSGTAPWPFGLALAEELTRPPAGDVAVRWGWRTSGTAGPDRRRSGATVLGDDARAPGARRTRPPTWPTRSTRHGPFGRGRARPRRHRRPPGRARRPVPRPPPPAATPSRATRTQRVYAVFAKTRAFDDLAVHPCCSAPSTTPSARTTSSRRRWRCRSAGRGGPDAAPRRGRLPLTRPHDPVVVNSMWALTDFTADNGATRLIPGSHRWRADRRPRRDGERAVPATMPAGSVLIYLGGLWHSGGANTTDHPRPGLLLEYVVSWLRPQETSWWRCRPTSPAPARTPAGAARLQRLPPFLGYVDGRHPGRILRSSAPCSMATQQHHTPLPPHRPRHRRRVLGGPARGQPAVRHVPRRPPLRRPGRRPVGRGRAAQRARWTDLRDAGGRARRRPRRTPTR